MKRMVLSLFVLMVVFVVAGCMKKERPDPSIYRTMAEAEGAMNTHREQVAALDQGLRQGRLAAMAPPEAGCVFAGGIEWVVVDSVALIIDGVDWKATLEQLSAKYEIRSIAVLTASLNGVSEVVAATEFLVVVGQKKQSRQFEETNSHPQPTSKGGGDEKSEP